MLRFSAAKTLKYLGIRFDAPLQGTLRLEYFGHNLSTKNPWPKKSTATAARSFCARRRALRKLRKFGCGAHDLADGLPFHGTSQSLEERAANFHGGEGWDYNPDNTIILEPEGSTTVDGWNPAPVDRWFIPIIYQVLAPSQVVGNGISAINSIDITSNSHLPIPPSIPPFSQFWSPESSWKLPQIMVCEITLVLNERKKGPLNF